MKTGLETEKKYFITRLFNRKEETMEKDIKFLKELQVELREQETDGQASLAFGL